MLLDCRQELLLLLLLSQEALPQWPAQEVRRANYVFEEYTLTLAYMGSAQED
jgi:hypothetical protein